MANRIVSTTRGFHHRGRLGQIVRTFTLLATDHETMRATRQPEILARQSLHGIDLFQMLDQPQLTDIAGRCQWGIFTANERIIGQELAGSDVYFIVTGRVRVTVFSAAGKEITFRDQQAGETFGELSAIDGKPRSAHVLALDESLVAWMTANDFHAVLSEFPDVARATMLRLTSLVRSLSDRVFEFSTLAVKNRIHAELLRLARSADAEANTVTIRPVPTHSEIASRLSTHREAVTRELNILSQKNIIERNSRKLTVLDVERLAAMVKQIQES